MVSSHELMVFPGSLSGVGVQGVGGGARAESVSRADTRLFQRGNWVLNYSARRILRYPRRSKTDIREKKALESGFRVSPRCSFCLLCSFFALL